MVHHCANDSRTTQSPKKIICKESNKHVKKYVKRAIDVLQSKLTMQQENVFFNLLTNSIFFVK